jgi:hypothetical protein
VNQICIIHIFSSQIRIVKQRSILKIGLVDLFFMIPMFSFIKVTERKEWMCVCVRVANCVVNQKPWSCFYVFPLFHSILHTARFALYLICNCFRTKKEGRTRIYGNKAVKSFYYFDLPQLAERMYEAANSSKRSSGVHGAPFFLRCIYTCKTAFRDEVVLYPLPSY